MRRLLRSEYGLFVRDDTHVQQAGQANKPFAIATHPVCPTAAWHNPQRPGQVPLALAVQPSERQALTDGSAVAVAHLETFGSAESAVSNGKREREITML